jgi:hypothetical protein
VTARRLLFLAAAAPMVAQAQSRLTGLTNSDVTPTFTYWTFSSGSAVQPDELGGDSVRVAHVWQFSIPIDVAVPIGSRVTVDASGAYQTGTVQLAAPDTALHTNHYTLSGITDIKLRMVARLIGDNVLLTLGVNAPTGTTNLNSEQYKALRVLAAPALELPNATLGTGPGGVVGIVLAKHIAGWSWAVGGSYELRGSYVPIEAYADFTTAPSYQPGNTAHFELGADGNIGSSDMTFGITGNVYAHDALTVTDSGGGKYTTDVQLGPSFQGTWTWQFATPGFRELSLYALDRYRTRYNEGGPSIPGTSGNYLDAGIRSALAIGDATSFTTTLGFVDQTGLSVDNSFATAGITAGTVTLGIARDFGDYRLEPFVRGGYGKLDMGDHYPTAATFGAGVVFRLRI